MSKQLNRKTFQKLLNDVACMRCELDNITTASLPTFTADNIIVANGAGALSEDTSQRFTYDIPSASLDIKNSLGSTNYQLLHGSDGFKLKGYGNGSNGNVNINHHADGGTESVKAPIVGDAIASRVLYWSHANNADGLASFNIAGEARMNTYERSDGWHAGAYTWTAKPISGGASWGTQSDVMELTSESLRLHNYGLGNITSAAITAALGALASGGPGAAADSNYILGLSTNGHLIEVDKLTLGGDNLYTTDDELTSLRTADLRTFDLNWRRGGSGSELPMMSMDASSGRVTIGGTTGEGFAILHVKSQGAGDGQVFVVADNTNALQMRVLNSGTLRLDSYGLGNKSATALSKIYTNNTIFAPADDGTLIEVESPAFGAFNWVSATLSVNTNDLSPAGLATANVIARNGTGAINVTGLDSTDAVQGTEMQIHNRGTGILTLTHADVLSTIGNRFKLPGGAPTAVGIDSIATVIYNGLDWYLKSVS